MSMKLQYERGNDIIKQKGAMETEWNHFFLLSRQYQRCRLLEENKRKRIDYQ